MIPKKGITPHPGEMLSEEFLKPMGITQAAFARHIGVDVATLSAVINGRRDMTPTRIMKISMALGVDPETWMSLQAMHDFTKNRESLRAKRQLPKIKALKEAREPVGA
ncbi:MAG: HigA family addiction module antidote protein [Planctomycetota bacterium]|jgi:addiction module HigA family antidote|nr:HigA family addiction module antidote protein [Planctomycetota bacterium]